MDSSLLSTLSDPNFPSHLDICPSAVPTSVFTAESGNFDRLESDARFDAPAQKDAIRTYGIAGRIWEASYVMIAYLSSLPGSLEPPPFTAFTSSSLPHTIVELGSGTGFLAARIARLLHPDTDLFIATDLTSVCPLLQKNLRDLPVVQVQPLAWGNMHHAAALATDLGLNVHDSNRPARYPTHILCSDLVYFPALLAPLLRTLLHLTSPPFLSPSAAPPIQVLLSYKIRSLPKETPFWSALGLYFTLTPVLSPSGRFAPSDGDAFILVATRRPESLRWAVPADDRELLGGVGAMGTDTWKEDDQFETMLLMEIGLGLSDDEDGEAA